MKNKIIEDTQLLLDFNKKGDKKLNSDNSKIIKIDGLILKKDKLEKERIYKDIISLSDHLYKI